MQDHFSCFSVVNSLVYNHRWWSMSFFMLGTAEFSSCLFWPFSACFLVSLFSIENRMVKRWCMVDRWTEHWGLLPSVIDNVTWKRTNAMHINSISQEGVLHKVKVNHNVTVVWLTVTYYFFEESARKVMKLSEPMMWWNDIFGVLTWSELVISGNDSRSLRFSFYPKSIVQESPLTTVILMSLPVK